MTPEVRQALGLENVELTVTAVEMVRGALATCHVWLNREVEEKDLWAAYRGAYGSELELTNQQVGQIFGASLWPIAVTIPKSDRNAAPCASKRTLAGLTSRWRIPRA